LTDAELARDFRRHKPCADQAEHRHLPEVSVGPIGSAGALREVGVPYVGWPTADVDRMATRIRPIPGDVREYARPGRASPPFWPRRLPPCLSRAEQWSGWLPQARPPTCSVGRPPLRPPPLIVRCAKARLERYSAMPHRGRTDVLPSTFILTANDISNHGADLWRRVW
jgi:hypothetical protein